MNATICSFDKEVGTCLLRDGCGKLRWAYACNIAGRRTSFAETASVYFDGGDAVEFYLKNGFVVIDTWSKFDELKRK